jgi:tRNA (guanine37-N1)-methyltransferase
MANRTAKTFDNDKASCLGKRDKSFAGRIDVKAVEICSVINERQEYYTLSSCSGRCFLYQGHGIKSSTFLEGQENRFQRWRISHDLVREAVRYFDLNTLMQDPTGGGDPVRTIGQFQNAELALQQQQQQEEQEEDSETLDTATTATATESTVMPEPLPPDHDSAIWLRFEPFILHVCCRSLLAASALMAAARPSFKNVGLTKWKDGRYIVAIWGDEGLDMPLCTPQGLPLLPNHADWLQSMVNERHERNWSKIERFVQGVRAMPVDVVDEMDDGDQDENVSEDPDHESTSTVAHPKSFDVVGDVALLHGLPSDTYEYKLRVGEAILRKNKALKVVALRTTPLSGTDRSPGDLEIIAGSQRSPLITTHTEFGIRCVVDLNHCFFSPRMSQERLRICQQVARGEQVLVLFAGVGMEAVQIAGRTEASTVLAIELNPVGIKCAHLAHRMLERNKAVKTVGAADRLQFMEGNVLDILPTLSRNYFDRVLVPRPKEGKLDGDLGSGDFGASFLDALLPVMKERGSECHWYDFASDIEFPACERTRKTIEDACNRQSLSHQIIHVANAGSVAKRQLRVCVDFRLCGKSA